MLFKTLFCLPQLQDTLFKTLCCLPPPPVQANNIPLLPQLFQSGSLGKQRAIHSEKHFCRQARWLFWWKILHPVLHHTHYLGAAPIPYVQDNIFNLPNPYIRSTTILLDERRTRALETSVKEHQTANQRRETNKLL